MAKLTTDNLKKHLKAYEQEELIKIIADLSKRSKKARKYLAAEVKAEEEVQALYEEAKQAVKGYVAPDAEDSRPRLSKAKRRIEDFRKSTGNIPLTVDLMVYYVEEGTEFAAAHKDVDEKFYSKMIAMYAETAEELEKDELLFHQFNIRLHRILEVAAPIDTEYPAALTDIYHSISWVEDEE